MISPLAGKPAPESILANIPRLVTDYYAFEPDAAVPAQRVAFGIRALVTSLAALFVQRGANIRDYAGDLHLS